MATDPLLSSDALLGRQVALSVSDTPDLDRLGLLDEHFDLALAEIARTVITAGGKLAYGGHLRRRGRTDFLVSELSRWQGTTGAITLYLPWSVHRAEPVSELRAFRKRLGRLGTIEYLDAAGERIEDFSAARPPEGEQVPDDEVRSGLTGMRRYVTAHTQARVLLGGKRAGFLGRYPGLVEEALMSIEKEHPVFLAGGFGGVTLDIVGVVEPAAVAWLPAWPDASPPDERLMAGLEALGRVVTDGWASLRNGLTDEENRRLAATHRPSEIAALIGLGVGRLPPPPVLSA